MQFREQTAISRLAETLLARGRLLWASLRKRWFILVCAEACSAWLDNNTLSLGAALAYYAVFSFGPLLLIVVGIAGLAWGHDAAQGALTAQLRQLAGADGATAMQSLLASTNDHSSNIVASIIGFVTLLVGASAVFTELKQSLNLIWKVPAKSTSGLWAFARSRLLSFALILALGFLLLVSLVISAGFAVVSGHVGALVPLPSWAFHVAMFLGATGAITVLFAMIFKILPDTPVLWSDVWLGAAVTSVLFAIGKSLIGLYLGHSSTASVYGAAGSVVVVMVWTYYSAQILFFGAEFAEVYSRLQGSRKVAAVPTQLQATPAAP